MQAEGWGNARIVLAFQKILIACLFPSFPLPLVFPLPAGSVGAGELSPREPDQDHARVGRRGQGPHLWPVRKKRGKGRRDITEKGVICSEARKRDKDEGKSAH